MRTVEHAKKKIFSGKSWVYHMVLQSMKYWVRVCFFFFWIGKIFSFKICIQFHLWIQVLIFITGETKMISKCSDFGRQWIEVQEILRVFFFYLNFYCAIPMLYPMDTSGGWKCKRNLLDLKQWWLLSLGFSSVYYNAFIMPDYLIFIISLLNLTLMVTADCQWQWLHIISLSAHHPGVETFQAEVRNK